VASDENYSAVKDTKCTYSSLIKQRFLINLFIYYPRLLYACTSFQLQILNVVIMIRAMRLSPTQMLTFILPLTGLDVPVTPVHVPA